MRQTGGEAGLVQGSGFAVIKSTALWTASEVIVSLKEVIGEQMMWDGAITQFSQAHLAPFLSGDAFLPLWKLGLVLACSWTQHGVGSPPWAGTTGPVTLPGHTHQRA